MAILRINYKLYFFLFFFFCDMKIFRNKGTTGPALQLFMKILSRGFRHSA